MTVSFDTKGTLRKKKKKENYGAFSKREKHWDF